MMLIKCESSDDMNVVFLQYQEDVKNRIFDEIVNNPNAEEVTPFQIEFIDKSTENLFDFNIKKEEFEANLEDLLKYFLKIEDYEKCSRIQNILQNKKES